MDNSTMARLLAETADLLEIDGGDSFRIRSYRRAADASEQTTVNLEAAAADTARLLEIPGIGKGMAANLQAIAATGTLPLRDELLAKYGAGVLSLLREGLADRRKLSFEGNLALDAPVSLHEFLLGHLAKEE